MQVYLDYAASTPVYDEVLEVLQNSLHEDFANPSSAHKLGRNAYKKIDCARTTFLEILNASKDDFFIFPSSATEANNTIVKALNLKEGDQILSNLSDHASLVKSSMETCKNLNLDFVEIPLQKGFVDLDKLLKLITPSSKLLMLALVNNHSGHIQNINIIAQAVKQINNKIHIHVDAVQGMFKIDWKKSKDIDSISISGHKLGAPKGIAGLYLKNNKSYVPLLYGGGQDKNLRSSTLATPMILSFEKATLLSEKIYKKNFARACHIQQKIRNELSKISNKFVFPFEFNQNMSPYILLFFYDGISGDILLRHLEEKEIYISTSSACSSKIKGFQEVFKALSIDDDKHKFMMRISFGPFLRDDQINYFIISMKEIIREWEELF